MAHDLNNIRVTYKGHTISIAQHHYDQGSSIEEILNLGNGINDDFSGDLYPYYGSLVELLHQLNKIKEAIDADTYE
jgi:hypothetical protein